MTTRVKATLLGCALLGLGQAATAVAAPIQASIRVEGSTSTIITERPQVALETRVADHGTGVRTVAGPSALGQLIRAGVATDTPIRTSFSDAFGPLAAIVEAIGPDDQGRNFEGPGFWLFKVNHRSSDVGANQRLLRKGDEVLWYFTSNFSAAELDLTAPSRPRARGARFTVTVTAYDSDGKGTPAAGARVNYAGTVRRTNASGRATFAAKRGERRIRATRGQDIRSSSESLCGYIRSPRECLPTRPFGGTLRVITGGTRYAGWDAASGPLRAIAQGRGDSDAILAWRGRVYRTPDAVTRVSRTLVRRYLG